MPRPTPPVKRVCYADNITVWATGPKIPQLESMITNYLRDVSICLKDNSLLISASKSTVALFTPDKHQFQMHPDITLEDTQLPLEHSPKHWKWFWIHPYPSTSTATMCQIGSRREIICWRHWRNHHGDRIRRLYWWHTTHWGNLSQTMQHQSGAPTQVTRALRRYRQRRMRLWGRRPGPTRWPVLTISTRSPSRWESRTTQICFLRSTL